MPPVENNGSTRAKRAEKQTDKETDGKLQEVRHFISSMEERVKTLVKSCELLEAEGVNARLPDFRKFQALVSENLTFLLIIEKRLERIPKRNKQELADSFDDLVVAVWSVVMTGSLGFMMVIAEEEYLPLGTREVFVRELKTLNDANSQLTSERYRDRLSEELQAKCEKAESIIMLIIDRAPSLLAF